MIKSQGPIFENACHEGNYGLRFILSIARWEEGRAAAEADLGGRWKQAEVDGVDGTLATAFFRTL